MKKLANISKMIRSNFFAQLLVFFFASFLITQLLSIRSYLLLKKNYEKALVDTQVHLSTTLSTSINRMLGEVFQANYLIGLDDDVRNVYASHTSISGWQDYYMLPGVIRTLSSVTAYSDYIAGIAIYKRDSNLVISDKSVYDDEEYFNLYHHYELYDYDFWKSLDTQAPCYKMLSSTASSTYMGGSTRTLLPVIQSGAFGSYSPNLFIIDLNYDAISKMLASYTPTQNSAIFVLDKETRQILFESTASKSFDVLAQYDKIFTGDESTFKAESNGNEYIVVTQDDRMGFQPIKVVTCIPQTDIVQALKESGNTSIAQSLFWNFMVSLLLIYLLSRQAYRPVRKLMKSLTPALGFSSCKNEFEIIQDIYDTARQNLSRTQLQLDEAQKLALEQVLRKALLGKRLSAKEQQQIQSFGADCITSHFQAVLINPVYQRPIYDDFSNEFLSTVLTIIKGVIPNIFTGHSLYIVEIDTNQLCLLLCNQTADGEEILYRQCQALLDIFHEDRRYLSLFMYIGDCLPALDGLAASFASVQSLMAKTSPYSECYIVGGMQSVAAREICLSADIENKLTNLVAAGKREPAIIEIDRVLKEFMSSHPSASSIKHVTMQCYFIAVRALQQNGLELSQDLNRRFADFNANLSAHPSQYITEFVLGFFDALMNSYGEIDYSLNTKLFKDYIDSNYHLDLSLEHLAQKYHTSPQYISRLIKKELDMPYQTYINKLRIDKAQELLVSSDLPVTEIYEQVGYNSRNTFIRTFKILCGVTPTEYRRMHRVDSSISLEETSI